MSKNVEKTANLQDFLKEAKDALLTLDENKKELNLLKGKKNTFEENEKKLQDIKEKLIDKTIKERRKELVSAFDQKLVELDSALKKAKKEKEKERQKIIKEKVTNGTKTKKDNIVFLKNNISSIIKEKKLSKILSFDFYYYIFAPSKLTDYIIGGLVFVLVFVGVPTLICLIFQRKMTFWVVVMTFVLSTFLFGIVYLFICHIGECDKETLKELRELRKDIKENEKEIHRITSEISKGKTDEAYTRTDRMIESINLDIKNLQEKQAKSLETFENSTKNTIIKEIEKESKKDFLANEKELKKATTDFEKVEKKYSDLKKQIDTEYIKKIGKENFDIKTIEKLINIVEGEDVENLEKALKLAKK